MDSDEIKRLDQETLRKLTEGKGPADECLCSVLASASEEKKGFRQSIKKAFASIQGQPGRRSQGYKVKGGKGGNTVDIPLTFTKGGKGIFTTKETVKTNCGKCGCSKENIVLKHSYANIRITSPDVSNICPCPSDCLPEKAKLANNIKVTIERLAVDGAPAPERTEAESGVASQDTLDLSENLEFMQEEYN